MQNNLDQEYYPTGLIQTLQGTDRNKCKELADNFYRDCENSIDQIEKGKKAHCIAWAIGGAAAGTLVSKSPLGTIIGGGITLAGCFFIDWLDSAFYAGKAGCAMEAQRIYDLCMTESNN